MKSADMANESMGMRPLWDCANETMRSMNVQLVKGKLIAFNSSCGASSSWSEEQISAIAFMIMDGHYRTITIVDVELVLREALHGYDDGKVSLWNVSTMAVGRLFKDYEGRRMEMRAFEVSRDKQCREEREKENSSISDMYKRMQMRARPEDFDKDGNDIREQRIAAELKRKHPECYDEKGEFVGNYEFETIVSKAMSVRDLLKKRTDFDVEYEKRIKQNGYKPI